MWNEKLRHGVTVGHRRQSCVSLPQQRFNFNFLNISFFVTALLEKITFLSVCPSAILQRKRSYRQLFFHHLLAWNLLLWILIAHKMSLLLQDKMCHCSICYSFADDSVWQHAAELNIPKKKKLYSPTDLVLTEVRLGLINHFPVLLTVPGGVLRLPPQFNISWYHHKLLG